MADLVEIIFIGLVLSADSFSAALALGSRPHKMGDTLKFALSSGGAEALVSFVGAMAGAKIIAEFDSIDHWVSFILLLGVGIHMAYEGIEELRSKSDDRDGPKEFHRFYKVLLVSFATSLDALAVGVGLGVSGKKLWPYVASIGFWAFLSTVFGMSLAKVASRKVGPYFNLLGSLILIGLGFKFLIDGLH